MASKRAINENRLTQDLYEGDKVQVYDARKYRENEDGTIELGELITEGLVTSTEDRYTGNGLVSINTLDKDIIITEHNFKLLSEGHIDEIYEELIKDKKDTLYQDFEFYRNITSIRERELMEIEKEIESLQRSHTDKVNKYNKLVNVTRDKAYELGTITGKHVFDVPSTRQYLN